MSYVAPRWLPGPHAQTIWPAVLAPRSMVRYQRVRWLTPDNDFVDIDFALEQGSTEQQKDQAPRPDHQAMHAQGTVDDPRPMLVLFHGLEGNSSSHYATALMAAALRRNWRAAVVHFRGCSGEPNLAPRAYHSGDSDEIDWVLQRFRSELAQGSELFAVGVSLGGNALAKWLGERGSQAAFIAAAATVCAPHDLQAGALALSRGFARVYTANFLRTLKVKSLEKLTRFPHLFDRQRMLTARDFFDFDDAVTAPMHGFRSCYDYWERSSCRRFMGGIRVPTLLINSRNDPFIPESVLARPDQISSQVQLDYQEQG
ncbi:MAG: alpha/beta fold hydrolase, partial [Quisquiliibacterium sp.]